MVSTDVVIGSHVTIHHPDLVNLYGCRIGDRSKIGSFVEIQRDVSIGADCKISSHSFLCSHVVLEDGVFVGHGVMFTNDLYPRALNAAGVLQTEADWTAIPTHIRRGASLGSNCTILAGVTVGRSALVGAGAVVTHDVPDYAIVAGVPARILGDVRDKSSRCSAGGADSREVPAFFPKPEELPSHKLAEFAQEER